MIATIRRSPTTEAARNNLREAFKFSEVQAQAILDMRLARLAALERKKIEDELEEVLKEITYLEGLLADPLKILGLIRDDVNMLKEKYGDVRRTRIQDVSGALSEEDLIPEVDVLVTLTNRGYVKRMRMTSIARNIAADAVCRVSRCAKKMACSTSWRRTPWIHYSSSPTGARSIRSRFTSCRMRGERPRDCRSST